MKKWCLKVVGSLVAAALLITPVGMPSTMAQYPEPEGGSPPVDEGCRCSSGNTVGQELPEGVQVEELTGTDLEKAVDKARKNRDVQASRKFLGQRFTLQAKKATKITLQNKSEVLVVAMAFKKAPGRVSPFRIQRVSTHAKLVFLKSDIKTQAGVGIVHETRDGSITSVFDASNDRVAYSSSITKKADGTIEINLADGEEFTFSAGTSGRPPGKSAPLAWDNCSICQYVCGVMESAGCGLIGYFACTSICAGVTGPGAPACPVVCAVVWGVACGTAGTIQCNHICGPCLGYCD